MAAPENYDLFLRLHRLDDPSRLGGVSVPTLTDGPLIVISDEVLVVVAPQFYNLRFLKELHGSVSELSGSVCYLLFVNCMYIYIWKEDD